MSLPLSRDLGAVVDEAEDIAQRAEQTLSSAHLLLALFTVTNPAAIFLQDRHVSVDGLVDQLGDQDAEDPKILDRIYERGERIASGSNAETIGSLHLLAALVRESAGKAVTLLDDAGANVGAIRASVMSYATGSTPLPRRLRMLDTPAKRPAKKLRNSTKKRPEQAPSPIGFHPSLGVVDPHQSRAAVQTQTRPDTSRPNKTPRDTATGATNRLDDASSAEGDGRRARVADEDVVAPTPSEQTTQPPDEADEAAQDARQTAQNLAKRLFDGAPADQTADAGQPASANPLPSSSESTDDAPTNQQGDDQQGDDQQGDDQQGDDQQGDDQQGDDPRQAPSTTSASPARNGQRSEAVGQVHFEDPLEPDRQLAQSYELRADAYPNLVEFGRNLTAQAARGQIDRVVGRDQELLQLIDILGKRRSNNPVLVGEAGVGKTAIVEGLSREFVKLAQHGKRLGERAIVELELGRLLSGTHLRGSFSERLTGIKDEVEQAGGDVIVFLDELHAWMSAGGGADGADAAGELKTALARGRFPCVGATTLDEFQSFIETDSALQRRFQMVHVAEPDIDTARHITDGIRGHYEDHHGVRYDDKALDAAVRLSHRYIYQRRLPDKAIGVLDLAGSRAARTGQASVDRRLVAEVVAEMAGIPADRLTQTDRQRFLDMESYLQQGVVGHRQIIGSIADVIRRNYAGFRAGRPIGSLLFLGPTGVGKTEMVKVLADFLFHDRDAVVRLDMSEFMEAHSVSRMVGAPPGYVGYDQGGQLTEAVRHRPYQIVLLDEIEKAHPDVLNLLLQLFDEGQLTDGRSRAVDFSNTVVIMTSNLGSEVFDNHRAQPEGQRIGFGQQAAGGPGQPAAATDDVLAEARTHFTSELWNRLDETLVFEPLNRAEIADIASLQLDDSRGQLADESGIDLDFGPKVIDFLIDNGGFDPELGARPMRRTIQRFVEGAVARLILSGSVSRGDAVRVRVDDGDITCEKQVN